MEINRLSRIEFALEFVHSVREKDRGIGGMKLWYMYRDKFGSNGTLGRDLFEDMINEYGLKVRNKIRKPKTTDSSHGLPIYPDIVKTFIPDAADQLWVSDITYLEIEDREGNSNFCYLSLILDAYTKEIVGYSVGDTLTSDTPIAALRMALKRIKGKKADIIHHSDRGVQYASKNYIRLLKANNIRISMTETGDPKDNAQAERINNMMKNELLKGMVFHTINEVRKAVEKAVDFYNNERPHMSINMMTPSNAALCTGEITKSWMSYREKAIKEKIKAEQETLNITENSITLPQPGASFQAMPTLCPG